MKMGNEAGTLTTTPAWYTSNHVGQPCLPSSLLPQNVLGYSYLFILLGELLIILRSRMKKCCGILLGTELHLEEQFTFLNDSSHSLFLWKESKV